MLSERWAVAALRVLLVALFGLLVVFQTLSLPGGFAHMARQSPPDAHPRWPLTAVSVFWVLCVQVVIVAVWRLLTLVRGDRIFTGASPRWVNTIVAAVAAAWLVLLGVFVVVVVNADDPGAPMVLLLLLTGVTVTGLLMIVMRALLPRSTAMRADMDTVI